MSKRQADGKRCEIGELERLLRLLCNFDGGEVGHFVVEASSEHMAQRNIAHSLDGIQ